MENYIGLRVGDRFSDGIKIGEIKKLE